MGGGPRSESDVPLQPLLIGSSVHIFFLDLFILFVVPHPSYICMTILLLSMWFLVLSLSVMAHDVYMERQVLLQLGMATPPAIVDNGLRDAPLSS